MRALSTLSVLLTLFALITSIYTGTIIWGLWITTALITYLPIGLISHFSRRSR
jgi:hypothetical protein